jgi:hypothetical protein
MSQVSRRQFQEQHSSAALFALVVLVSLLLQTLSIAPPAQARPSAPPPSAPSGSAIRARWRPFWMV